MKKPFEGVYDKAQLKNCTILMGHPGIVVVEQMPKEAPGWYVEGCDFISVPSIAWWRRVLLRLAGIKVFNGELTISKQ